MPAAAVAQPGAAQRRATAVSSPQVASGVSERVRCGVVVRTKHTHPVSWLAVLAALAPLGCGSVSSSHADGAAGQTGAAGSGSAGTTGAAGAAGGSGGGAGGSVCASGSERCPCYGN